MQKLIISINVPTTETSTKAPPLPVKATTGFSVPANRGEDELASISLSSFKFKFDFLNLFIKIKVGF